MKGMLSDKRCVARPAQDVGGTLSTKVHQSGGLATIRESYGQTEVGNVPDKQRVEIEDCST